MEIAQASDNDKFKQTMVDVNVCSQNLVLQEKNQVLHNKTIDLKQKLEKKHLMKELETE